MRQVTYTDKAGRRWATLIPDQAPDNQAGMGLPIGPPSLAALNLPRPIEVRLHNQLHDRGLLTAADARRRRGELASALMAALKLDVGAIADVYALAPDGG